MKPIRILSLAAIMASISVALGGAAHAGPNAGCDLSPLAACGGLKITSCYGGTIAFSGVAHSNATWKAAWLQAVDRWIYVDEEAVFTDQSVVAFTANVPIRLGVINYMEANLSVLQPDHSWHVIVQESLGCFDG